MDEQKTSILLKGFGAISPIQRPEGFERLRAAFEKAVAEEVMAEMKALDMTCTTDVKEQE